MAPKTFTFPPPPPPPTPQFSPPPTDYGFRGQRGGGRGRGSGRGAPRGRYSRFPGPNGNLNNTYGNGGGSSNPHILPVQGSINHRGNVAYYNPNFIQRNPQLVTSQAQANGNPGRPLFGNGNQCEIYGEESSNPGTTHLNPRASSGSWQDVNGKRSYNNAFPRDYSQRSASMVSPAVPSFGAPLPTASSKIASVQMQRKTNKKSMNLDVNALGLTPASLDYESSSEGEDYMDEVLMLLFWLHYRAKADSDFLFPSSAKWYLQTGIKARLHCYGCSFKSSGVSSKYSIRYCRLTGSQPEHLLPGSNACPTLI